MEDLNVDDILGEDSQPVETEAIIIDADPKKIVDQKAIETFDYTKSYPEVKDLQGRLAMWNEHCRSLLIDLRTVTFKATPDDMSITCTPEYYDKPLFFKADPANPHDTKVTHAQKQFCKFLGIPHNFFISNRPTLKENIVRTWQSGLNAQASKAQVVARIREGKDCAIIRAFISPTNATPLNHDIVSLIMEAVKTPLTLNFVVGDEKDDPILHARFLFEREYRVAATPVQVGFSLMSSELGAAPLTVEILLYDKDHDTSYIASYGAGPFFKTKGDGIQLSEIRELFPKMIARMEGEADEMVSRVTKTVEDTAITSLEEECVKINRMRGVSGKFKRAIYHQVIECKDDIHTAWDFARHVSLVAKDYEPIKRMAVERAAGTYLDLMFSKE